MTASYNGWSASPTLSLRPLVVDGVAFVPGIRDDDAVATVLGYVAEQVHRRVEPLRNAGCWGFSYRENRNAANLSNHASGTAIDANAPAHPNGVPAAQTFTPAQIAEIHQILAEVDHVVRWGGDYTGTPDAMHFEINADRAAVEAVATRLEDDMYTDEDRKRDNRTAKIVSNQAAIQKKRIQNLNAKLDAIATEQDATARQGQIKALKVDVADLAALVDDEA